MNRLPSSQLGWKGFLKVFSQGFATLLGKGVRQRRSTPAADERIRFERDVREQFLKLKEKGLSISVFTL